MDQAQQPGRQWKRLALRRARFSPDQPFFKLSPHPILIFDEETLQIVEVNPAAEAHYGYPRETFKSMTMLDIRPPEDVPRLLAYTADARGSSQAHAALWRHRKSDGQIIYVHISNHPLRLGGRRCRVTFIADITERLRMSERLIRVREDQDWQISLRTAELRESEHQLRRTVRILRLTQEINQTLQSAQDPEELLASACRLLTEEGGYTLAWVGYRDGNAEGDVRLVAKAGPDTVYLDTLRVRWADEPQGQGPTGIAIRTGKAAVARDIRTDPRMGPWREEARRTGFGSSIALPLKAGGHTFGALTLYARQPDAFCLDEQRLLASLADTLAFGVTALLDRAERARVEEEARRLAGVVGQAASVLLPSPEERHPASPPSLLDTIRRAYEQAIAMRGRLRLV